MKLAIKLSLFFVLISIIGIFIVGYLSFTNGKTAIEDEIINHLTATNLLKEAEIERWLENNENILEFLVENSYFKDEFSNDMFSHDFEDDAYKEIHKNIIEEILMPGIRESNFFEFFLIRLSDGLVTLSTDAKQEGKFREDQQYFISGKKQTYTQNIYYSMSLQQPTMVISTPIKNRQGNILAVIAGRLDLAELSGIMEKQTGLSQTEDTYLINKFNFFITEPRFGKDYALKQTIYSEGVNAALEHNDGIGFYDDYRGEPVIGVYNWMSQRELAIITEIDQSEAYAPIYDLRKKVIIFGIGATLFAALVGWLLALTITKPLSKLVRQTERISKGNFDYKYNLKGNDEISSLSKAFSRMAEKLSKTLISRDKLSKEVLMRKQAEQEITSIAKFPSENPNPVIRIDKEGEIIYSNDAGKIQLKNLGLKVGSRAPKILYDAVIRIFRVKNSKPELLDVQVDDKVYEFTITPIRDSNYTNLYSRDVTERNRTMKMLKTSNTELQQFAYVASHDLQEPLRVITSYVQLLAKRYKDKLDPDANDFIGFIEDRTIRMQNMINDLLSFSRISTKGKPLIKGNLEEMVERAISNLKLSIEESGADIKKNDLPTIYGDPSQLIRLFQNLIENAIKFKGEKPLKISIGSRQEKGKWIISVSDNGIGIDPQHSKRIFDIFQTLHSKDDYPGTGIGLAIAKRIVERHKGEIWVESEAGKGAIFYFTLPKRKGR